MSYFTDQLRTVGTVMDDIAGVEARYTHNGIVIIVTCVPTQRLVEDMADGFPVRVEMRDFYLHHDQLILPSGDTFLPAPDDTLTIHSEVFKVVGGKAGNRSSVVATPYEFTTNDGTRIRVHTVRIRS